MRYKLLIIISCLFIFGCSKKEKIARGEMSASKSVKELQQKILRAQNGNKKLSIEQVYDLNGATVNVKNLNLSFSKNSLIKNGTLQGDQATLKITPQKYFDNIILTGSWSLEKGYLEWFIGTNNSNAFDNFKALSNLISIGVEVELLKMYSIATNTEEDFFETSQDIKIKGKEKNKSGLILETRHPNSSKGYFRSDGGNNLSLTNLTMQTRDFLNKNYSNKECDYSFVSCAYNSFHHPEAKPDTEYLKIENCIINGAISLVYFASNSMNQSITEFKNGNTVNQIHISDSDFNYCNSPFGFSNVGYDKVVVDKNRIKNFSSSFISFPASGIKNQNYYPILYDQRKRIEITNNFFGNDHVIKVPKGKTMTPTTTKGGNGTFLFANNTLNYLLSDSKEANVNYLYFTCSPIGKAEIYDNNITNVLCKGSAKNSVTLVKERGARNLFMKRNRFEITKQALVDIGVLRSRNQQLKTLTGNDIFLDFMQVGISKGQIKSYTITDNEFIIPYLNKSTDLFDVANFVFRDNIIRIEHFGKSKVASSVSVDGVFFLYRQRFDLEKGKSPGKFISQNNKIYITSVEGKMLNYIFCPQGVQNGTVQNPDRNYNYQTVIFDDKIYSDNLTMGYTLLDGISQNFNSTITGRETAFRIQDVANGNHLRSNAKDLHIDLKVGNYKSNHESFPFTISPNSIQKLSSTNNQSSEINLTKFNNQLAYFNLKKDLPIQIDININYIDKSGKKKSNSYNWVFEHLYRGVYHKDRKGRIKNSNLHNELGAIEIIQGDVDTNFDLVLQKGFKDQQEAQFKFINTKHIKSFDISMKCSKVLEKPQTPIEYESYMKRKKSN